jgi:hypothetical protein
LKITQAGDMMVDGFEFQDNGRTFACSVEGPRGARREAWWWFTVSNDACRYAPFPAAAGDTQDAVRSRIVAFYDELLARRAMPAQPRHHWARRSKDTPPAAPATPGAPAAPAAPTQP